MKVSDFDYELPEELIAHYPCEQRSASRLLHLGINSDNLEHFTFNQITDLINSNDLLVFNNTKVIPARLFAKKETGGQVEILVERILSDYEILAHIKASKSPKLDMLLHLKNRNTLRVTGRADDLFILRFETEQPVLPLLQEIGHIPLPPYIKRDDEKLDSQRYQTVYAESPGAVAAPTAGLHFDEPLLETLRQKKVDMAFLTLHVGAGTFQSIRVDDVEKHTMHTEYFEVSAQVAEQIKKTKSKGGRVIAVGTTSVRALESMAQKYQDNFQACQGETSIFIYPGFEFQVVDAMITNFHLPQSTLLMLVSAFAGCDKILSAYKTAVEKQYRFFSYGDAMFITGYNKK